ncbi:hypothetical protein M4951_16555 [Blastopirellula sp. J2-11]|uniref:hypothetical protein n=1 Tax=Blastopirellula sp. J2-11 TaxID=2943192 RepID=UPI0021C7D345|nr:hypothetical protein [Blastopirellula sp. J2-11]UUO04991.1 hypothetical protein M4951_16555 [Blastopirellula sp. J2-11]
MNSSTYLLDSVATRFRIAGLIIATCFGIVLTSVGCSRETEAIAAAGHQATESAPSSAWDAGIVFPGEVTTITFPLEVAEIADASGVDSIATSCECAVATACDYINARGERRVAVQIKFDEPAQDHAVSRGIMLRVGLEIRLKSGQVLDRDISVLISGAKRKAQGFGAMNALRYTSENFDVVVENDNRKRSSSDILGLKSPWSVDNVQQSAEEQQIDVNASHPKGTKYCY